MSYTASILVRSLAGQEYYVALSTHRWKWLAKRRAKREAIAVQNAYALTLDTPTGTVAMFTHPPKEISVAWRVYRTGEEPSSCPAKQRSLR